MVAKATQNIAVAAQTVAIADAHLEAGVAVTVSGLNSTSIDNSTVAAPNVVLGRNTLNNLIGQKTVVTNSMLNSNNIEVSGHQTQVDKVTLSNAGNLVINADSVVVSHSANSLGNLNDVTLSSWLSEGENVSINAANAITVDSSARIVAVNNVAANALTLTTSNDLPGLPNSPANTTGILLAGFVSLGGNRKTSLDAKSATTLIDSNNTINIDGNLTLQGSMR